MNVVRWHSWMGNALILLGLANVLFLKEGQQQWSTLITLGLVIAGVTLKGYEISLKAWQPEECRHALKRSWIGVAVIFLSLTTSWFLFKIDYLLLGSLFVVIAGTIGPLLTLSYFKCLRHGPS